MFRNAALMGSISIHVPIQFGTTDKTIPILLGYSQLLRLCSGSKNQKRMQTDKFGAISKM